MRMMSHMRYPSAPNGVETMSIRETARQLNVALGPTLVAALSGNRSRTISLQWEAGEGPEPDASSSERLRCAWAQWQIVEAAEGPDVARMWFLGSNPWLGDDSPINAVREGWFGEVAAAAQALAQDAFSG